ncbi:MAG: dicarboxylate/amino acid:cation symporter [Hungatella sp.]|nr:dicarboxylate/amino acid:cation symporter [Hungatella sp.]
MENQKKQPTNALAKKMGISLVCGIGTGMALLFLRESLNGSGKEAAWAFINNLLFQDITAQGAEKTLGVFYLIGQLFIRCLQLVIVPMVFTSITLAIGQISDTRTLGRISAKTIGWFLICSFFALVLGCGAGSMVYRAGFFHTQVEGLAGSAGSTGANPMNVILNVVPANIITAFGSNTAVLAVVFVAACLGLSMNALGEERTCTLRKLIQEVNDIVVVFLNYVVTKFGPFAIFVLLTRTFATYGIDYLKPAFAYVLAAVAMLLLFLVVGYPLVVFFGAGLNPVIFLKKIMNVAVFGFSTSSSAATLPLNYRTCTQEFGVDETIASFVLPLGMTVNMNGTAIMQVIATVFIAGCAGYDISLTQLVVVALLALIASAGTPAAPGAGAIVLFTILSGVGFVNEGALLAYSLILAINRPIEMLVTALNVVGDAVTSIIVAKSEGLLDEEKYNIR